jgi:hypothetical protein
VDDGASCLCEGDVTTDGNAYALATCEIQSQCITAATGQVCGDVVLDGTFSAGSDGLLAYVNACLTVDTAASFSDDPVFADQEDSSVMCVSIDSSDGLNFDSCVATLRGETCTCQICEAGVPAVTLDCSMVDLSMPSKQYYGPKMNVCSLLDFSPAE